MPASALFTDRTSAWHSSVDSAPRFALALAPHAECRGRERLQAPRRYLVAAVFTQPVLAAARAIKGVFYLAQISHDDLAHGCRAAVVLLILGIFRKVIAEAGTAFVIIVLFQRSQLQPQFVALSRESLGGGFRAQWDRRVRTTRSARARAIGRIDGACQGITVRGYGIHVRPPSGTRHHAVRPSGWLASYVSGSVTHEACHL
jgi:hypothetical protein